MEHFSYSIAPDVFERFPGYVRGVVIAHQVTNGPSSPELVQLMREAEASVRARVNVEQIAEEPHIKAWREAYRAFGAKPQRTPCSAEALRRRAATLPAVNRLVDAYNALSLRYAVPIGGEDLDAYRGKPRLTVAAGGEPFATVRDGAPAVEPVEAGEVVWRDAEGVTCRRWNWRQSPRTRLEPHSTAMWFVLERLEPMPLAALEEAGAALVAAVRDLAPDAEVRSRLIAGPDGR
jgi:DNA/RNA-binding domain of Phe-tRNA-synthetase-like protein